MLILCYQIALKERMSSLNGQAYVQMYLWTVTDLINRL